MRTKLVVLMGAGLAWGGAAQAAPIVYDLRDVVFQNGVTASGTFTYDDETGEFSDPMIVLSDGSTFTQPSGSVPGDVIDFFTDAGDVEGGPFLQLAFSTLLDPSAGQISLVGPSPAGFTTFYAFCASDADDDAPLTCPLTGGANIASGSVVGDPVDAVPIPAAALLFAPALAGGAALRRARRV